jgi:hypothetical protein
MYFILDDKTKLKVLLIDKHVKYMFRLQSVNDQKIRCEFYIV